MFWLPDRAGADSGLLKQREGIILVHFFATWCEPCRDEPPALRRLVERSMSTQLTDLAISVGSIDDRVSHLSYKIPLDFRIRLNRDRAVFKAHQVEILTTTYLLDVQEGARLAAERALDWDSPDLRRLPVELEGSDANDMKAPDYGCAAAQMGG